MKNRNLALRRAGLCGLALFLCLSAVVLLSACGGKTQPPDETDPVPGSGEEPAPGTEPGTEPGTQPGTPADTGETDAPSDTGEPQTSSEDESAGPAEASFTTRPRTLMEGWTEKTDELTVTRIDVVPADVSSCDALTDANLSAYHWSTPYGGRISVANDGERGNYLRYTGMSQNWHTPAFDLFPWITEAGTYTVTLRYMAEGSIPASAAPFHMAIRGTRVNGFMTDQSGNIYVNVLDCPGGCKSGAWYDATFTFSVSAADLAQKDEWNLCFHIVDPSVTAICVDDLCVFRTEMSDPAPSFPTTAQTWVACEMVLHSDVRRADPVREAELDLVLTCGGTTLTVPGFWDGGCTWRVRFALPTAGEWTWRTVCTDASDAGLHGLTGSITCTAYDGPLDVYLHGFPTVTEGNRYFTYADGTPFLYLGDTHWTLFTEEFDAPGDHAGGTGAKSHFRYIIDQRVLQGFTVIQSEPIGSGINVANGITEADVAAFRQMDRYFAYIAFEGLVHANAQFFYPSEMVAWSRTADFDASLRAAARYWVARYAAYPVFWTLGQEVDKSFYDQFDAANNPYKALCAYMDAFDPYRHPITAHQENTGYTKASDSAFRDTAGHAWYAVQWPPELNKTVSFNVPKDFWENGQGKPAILYESLYDHLWTNHFGARAEGWLGFLNGMTGYGYGCADVWYYHSTYDMDGDSSNHGVTVTVADKNAPWSESVDFESAWQVGYMGDFLSNLEWWRLEPVFDDKTLFKPKARCAYSAAHIGDEVYVLYFYYDANRVTGTVKGLDASADYTLWWFDPRTGEWSAPTAVTAPDGSYALPDKPDDGDWTALLMKN